MNQIKKLRQVLENVGRIREEVTGHHNGQTDFSLFYEIGDEVVGRLDAVEFSGQVSISMIEVFDQGKGYGKALVRYLQSMYPDTEIEWGMTTDQGEALRKSLKYEKRPTKYKPFIDEYITLKAKRDEIQAMADDFHEKENPTEEEKEEFFAKIDLLNDIHDRLWDIEDMVVGESAYKYIII